MGSCGHLQEITVNGEVKNRVGMSMCCSVSQKRNKGRCPEQINQLLESYHQKSQSSDAASLNTKTGTYCVALGSAFKVPHRPEHGQQRHRRDNSDYDDSSTLRPILESATPIELYNEGTDTYIVHNDDSVSVSLKDYIAEKWNYTQERKKIMDELAHLSETEDSSKILEKLARLKQPDSTNRGTRSIGAKLEAFGSYWLSGGPLTISYNDQQYNREHNFMSKNFEEISRTLATMKHRIIQLGRVENGAIKSLQDRLCQSEYAEWKAIARLEVLQHALQVETEINSVVEQCQNNHIPFQTDMAALRKMCGSQTVEDNRHWCEGYLHQLFKCKVNAIYQHKSLITINLAFTIKTPLFERDPEK